RFARDGRHVVGSVKVCAPYDRSSVPRGPSARSSSDATGHLCDDSVNDWGGTTSTGAFARHNTRYAIEPGREPRGPWLLARPITITPARRWSAIDAIESAGRPLSTRNSHSTGPTNCFVSFSICAPASATRA